MRSPLSFCMFLMALLSLNTAFAQQLDSNSTMTTQSASSLAKVEIIEGTPGDDTVRIDYINFKKPGTFWDIMTEIAEGMREQAIQAEDQTLTTTDRDSLLTSLVENFCIVCDDDEVQEDNSSLIPNSDGLSTPPDTNITVTPRLFIEVNGVVVREWRLDQIPAHFIVNTGDGNDTIIFDNYITYFGAATLKAGSGNDKIAGESWEFALDNSSGMGFGISVTSVTDDCGLVSFFPLKVWGEDGDDGLTGSCASDSIRGGNGHDAIIVIGEGADVVNAEQGDDLILAAGNGAAPADEVDCGGDAGDDIMYPNVMPPVMTDCANQSPY